MIKLEIELPNETTHFELKPTAWNTYHVISAPKSSSPIFDCKSQDHANILISFLNTCLREQLEYWLRS
jgi:hypothetical protein